MATASDLIKLLENSGAKSPPETNSEIVANQLREISKLTKNPTLAKKIRDLADQAIKL